MGGQLCQEKKKNLLTQAIEKSSLAGSQFFSNHNANQPINENQIETLQAQVQFVLEKFSAFSAEHPLQSIKTADIHPSKLIGRGSFGKVYLVVISGQNYAMKQIKKKMLVRRFQVENLFYETNILLCHQHPFIVKLHYAFQDAVNVNLIMDFVPGGELLTHLSKKKKFDPQAVRFYAAQVVLVFEYLHNTLNVVYRDLKPENILIDRDGYIKLTDFGLAKDASTLCYSFCGTPEYLAPEVISEQGHATPVDLWTLGCFIFEMSFGYPPFRSNNKKDLYQQIQKSAVQFPISAQPECVNLLRALLDKDPLKRPRIEEVRRHAFFSQTDFSEIMSKQARAPFSPLILHDSDTRNFDNMFESVMLASHSKQVPTAEEDALFGMFETQSVQERHKLLS